MTQQAHQLDLMARAATSGSDWLATHGPGENSPTARKLRQTARLASRLAQAASRPPAVSVYGASQAGKSYLVSSLTSPENGPLTLCYGAEQLDFLKDMNPDGGGESSGLVTRFTTHIPPNTPVDAPVPVRLLSALDVLKITGNSFYADFKLLTPPPPAGTAATHIQQLLASLTPLDTPVLVRGDIEELEDYFTARHASNPWFGTLGAEYWTLLADHAAKMDAPTLVRALSPLWGNMAELGRFAGEAFQARLHLGKEDMAFCTTTALLPRERGILNVQTLTSTQPSGEETLQITTGAAQKVSITRRMASALVAELMAPLEQARWPFQKDTDVLDFPGARSRLLIRAEEDAQGKGAELFLRGKVDHLFQRYQQDFDITAMLLCIGDSAQEVRELPRLVTSWIDQTLGATPQARAAQEDALFLMLTKFDTALVAKEGSDDAQPGRWNERLGASIVNFFDTPAERAWLDEWKPGQGFNNVQWLRNSSYGDTWERDANGRETLLKPSLGARLPALKEGYLRSERVQRYIQAPLLAFDEAMKANDGGVSYLAHRLAPIAARNPKASQLRARALECVQHVQKTLHRFYHNETTHDPEAEARGLLEAVGGQILELARNRQVFGAFLRRLSPSRDDMMAAWKEFSREHLPRDDVSSDTLLAGLLGQGDEHSKNADGQKQKFDDFARKALTTWQEKTLLSLRDTPRELAYFGLTRESYERLISQVLALTGYVGKNGESLEQLLSKRLRESCDYDSPLNQSGEKQGVICAQTIGDFIAYLGYQPVYEHETSADSATHQHPINQQTKKPVFMLPDNPMASLTQTQQSAALSLTPELVYCLDWLAALLARAKASGPHYDRAANARLGAVLEQLKKVEEHLLFTTQGSRA